MGMIYMRCETHGHYQSPHGCPVCFRIRKVEILATAEALSASSDSMEDSAHWERRANEQWDILGSLTASEQLLRERIRTEKIAEYANDAD